MNPLSFLRLALLLFIANLLFPPTVSAEETTGWQIPLGGNEYLTKSREASSDHVTPAGISRWQEDFSVFSVFFHVDRPGTLHLSLRMKSTDGPSVILATSGKSRFKATVVSADFQSYDLGEITAKESGYLRLDLKGSSKHGTSFAQASDLLVRSKCQGLTLSFVKDNGNNRFYWGRRGPSVHLGYHMPEGADCEYFYNEVSVPEGLDPIGTYAMANGFGEGYFGMQVNGPKERRILFSVWSPFETDDPRNIPEDQRIKLLAKGSDVQTGEFGNEGSGGQSYLVYPWKAGSTYRFLNRARPDGDGNTIYTAWFKAPDERKWRLVASFSRPKTSKYLTRLHSFLENFRDTAGYLERGAKFSDQWICDTSGKWHPVTEANFTGDDIARRNFRLDFAGRIQGESFILQNGGFFNGSVEPGTALKLQDRQNTPPKIDFDSLDAVE